MLNVIHVFIIIGKHFPMLNLIEAFIIGKHFPMLNLIDASIIIGKHFPLLNYLMLHNYCITIFNDKLN